MEIEYSPASKNKSQWYLRKLKKRLWSKQTPALPVAKTNFEGRLVSAPADLKILMMKEYKDRLRSRPVHPQMKHLKVMRNKVISLKLKMAKRIQSPLFTMTELDQVLKSIKTGKAREGLSREVFKHSQIGSNLKKSLLQMCNVLKKSGQIPKFMRKATILAIPKEK